MALARIVAVDFLNLDNAVDYPIVWNTAEDTGPMIVYGDPDLLKRAMSNLITNAQVHNPKGCTIEIEAKEEAEMYALIVSDDGVESQRTNYGPYGVRLTIWSATAARGAAPWSGIADRKADCPGPWREGGVGSLAPGRISGEDFASERWGGNLTFLQGWKFISKFRCKQVTIMPGDEYENITCGRRSDPAEEIVRLCRKWVLRQNIWKRLKLWTGNSERGRQI